MGSQWRHLEFCVTSSGNPFCSTCTHFSHFSQACQHVRYISLYMYICFLGREVPKVAEDRLVKYIFILYEHREDWTWYAVHIAFHGHSHQCLWVLFYNCREDISLHRQTCKQAKIQQLLDSFDSLEKLQLISNTVNAEVSMFKSVAPVTLVDCRGSKHSSTQTFLFCFHAFVMSHCQAADNAAF